MSFKSLNHILGNIQAQSKWQEQPLQYVLKYWHEAVGALVATHTQPRSVERDILSVATSSAVWAQELTYSRQCLLIKLNAHLPNPISDIRFSTAQWQRRKNHSSDANQPDNFWQNHPSYLVDVSKDKQIPNFQNPDVAFEHWAKLTKERSNGLPLCPQCHCPTPVGELQRWAVCAICSTKEGSKG